MSWAGFFFVLFAFGFLFAALSPAQKRWEASRKPRTPRPPVAMPDEDDPYVLSLRDGPRAMAKFGTPADVERFIAEGREDELRANGWRPEDDNVYRS
jgi:hypothetical protein